MATHTLIVVSELGMAILRYTKVKQGSVMQAAMGQRLFFNPHREAAIPPIIPPTVRKITPIVPYTKPTLSVLNPNPPLARVSSKKGLTILSKNASGKR